MAAGLRELKKARTRAAIQAAAMELFGRQGYDGTTCEQIAAAAEVSPATFFRYFPTKEDVVLSDDYDPVMAEQVAGRPPEESPVQALRGALATVLAQLPEAEMGVVRARTRLVLGVPALRARSFEQAESTRASLARAFAVRMRLGEDDVRVQALAAACAAALAVGVEAWAAAGGDLRGHVDRALSALG